MTKPALPAAYREDLAYIHDVGYSDFVQDAAPAILAFIRQAGHERGLVVDLGCGGGVWAQALCAAGYAVLGIDQSPAMISLARARVPEAEFRVRSFLTADLPPCVAVTSVGECLGYLFDRNHSSRRLTTLFRRVYAALEPGGCFIFDMLAPGCVPGGRRQAHRQGDDWAVLVSVQEDRPHRLLTREITTFRRIGKRFRRHHEVHRVRLAEPGEIVRDLRAIGFRVRRLRGYHEPFAPGHFGILGRKPPH